MTLGDRLRRLGAPLRRLRWKMTLSYTVVTVGALLMVELLLLGGVILFWRLEVAGGPLLPRAFDEQLAQEFIPVLRPYLQTSPPDVQGLRHATGLFDSAEDRGGGGAVSLSLVNMQSGTWLFVLDPEGTLLAASGTRLNDTLGAPLSRALPAAESLVEAALARARLEERYRFADGEMILLSPILSEDETEVLGALGFIMPVPTMDMTFLRQVMPVIGSSLIFFTLGAGAVGALFGYITSRGLVRRLKRLDAAAGAWSRGDFQVFVRDASGDELAALAGRMNRMAEQVQNLLETRNRLAVLEERNRMARDLHDSAKQQAFAAAAQIGAARALLPTDPAAAEERMADAEELIYALRQELTNLIHELRPADGAGPGLAAALRAYAADWSRREGIAAEVQVSGEARVSADAEQALLRIAQEALTNVAKHSGAQQVWIALQSAVDDVRLEVRDAGRGFDPRRPTMGLGLCSMRERVESLKGGRLTVESRPGGGARIVASCSNDGKEGQR